jgi:hypothetical protein
MFIANEIVNGIITLYENLKMESKLPVNLGYEKSITKSSIFSIKTYFLSIISSQIQLITKYSNLKLHIKVLV